MNESVSAAKTGVNNRINRIDSNDSYVHFSCTYVNGYIDFGLVLHNDYRVAPENLE